MKYYLILFTLLLLMGATLYSQQKPGHAAKPKPEGRDKAIVWPLTKFCKFRWILTSLGA